MDFQEEQRVVPEYAVEGFGGIVEGARLGWWRGAEALELLVRIDERVQARWEIGAKSEAVARAALAEVRAKSR